ncbi:hypothetical protein Acsp03_62600 [Actinomadura sp. NBRC 104412]|nr:hypothetical protein Acsp03_62600 [Actinomadura sp. NBRC 104412]
MCCGRWNDKQRLNQEVMKPYQESGAKPLSGCLPLLVQMPVFIGLFQVLRRISDANPGEGVFAVTPELISQFSAGMWQRWRR